MSVRLATIGFTKKPLSAFISLLQHAKVSKVVDTRLRPSSQLSGFAKAGDLEFILRQFGIAYKHYPSLAPTDDLLRKYRADHDWASYEEGYRQLIRQRGALCAIERDIQAGEVACLLCSEHLPSKCHRRVLAEMYAVGNPDCDIVHLQ